MSAQFDDDMTFDIEPEAIRPMPAVRDTSPAGLLVLAVETNADLGKLEKLMDLHERWQKAEARKAFNAARAKFQAICPEIIKDCETKSGPKYKYASLPAIIRQIKQPLAESGLAYRFEFSPKEGGGLSVRCVLCHVDGHCESNEMEAAPDDSGAKNDIQKLGSTSTYLQRYTLLGALGIATADDDDDGKSAGETNVEELRKHNELVRDWFETITAIKIGIRDGNLSYAVEASLEMDDETKRGLNLAPSKGGVFTTRERDVMKSDEWGAEKRAMIQAKSKEQK